MTANLPDSSKIKLIATDLDGTLLNSKGQVSKKTKEVISKILDNNPELHFVIATGRTRASTLDIREVLGISNRQNTESLLNNGCIIYDSDGNILWQNELPIDYIMKVHNLIKPYCKAIYGFTIENGIITFNKTSGNMGIDQLNIETFLEDREKFIEKLQKDKPKIYKVGYVAIGEEHERIVEELEKLKEEYNLESVNYYKVVYEYMPYQTNKGTGLRELIKLLNISKDEVIAFGDGNNDLELLQNSGWPVAMENSCEELKPFAKIIAKSNEENGVADILEKIFLN